MPIITKELIESVKSENGGWTAKQLKLLGVKWPPHPGWKQTIIGAWISEEDLAKLQARDIQGELY